MKFLQMIAIATITTASVVYAQELPIEGPVPTTALINVSSKSGTALDPALLKLQVNRHDAPINDVTRVTPAATEVAILIDEGLRGGFSLQLNEIKSFLNSLPPQTKVMIGYMQNGNVLAGGGFTTDREQLASQLRVTMSVAFADASPYFSLSQFVKSWPSNAPAARFVLLITNGVDPYNGSASVLNQDSPYVQTAQEDAQRAGVAVYSIYYPQAGIRGGSFSGQSYLQQVAEATGGQLFNIGSIPPVSFAPYLKDFAKHISESYVVSFMGSSSKEKRNTLTNIKLTTSQPGVKIHAPQGVHPGV